MSKNTVDGNCMTKNMLIVMLSTNPAIGEKNIPMNKKRSIKNIFIFVFDRVRTGDLCFFLFSP